MMINIRKLSLEEGIYILLFGVALFVRVLNLGDAPLSDFEAGWALQSWNAAQGESVQIGPNPGYFGLTTFLFYLFGSSNALARFWPAVAGSLIVLVPFGLRRFLGRQAALVMAFGMALDPGMVALSRLAGGPMMAVGFSSVALAFFVSGNPVWTGIFSGLSLISGPSVFVGALGFAVAYFAGRITGILPNWYRPESADPSRGNKSLLEGRILRGAIFLVLTALLVSTLFVRFPAGIGAWGNALAVFLKGWVQSPIVPVFQPLLAVVFYQPLAMVFALLGTVRGWLRGDHTIRWLSVWTLTALSFTILYSGRYVYDSVWMLLPLWGLAGIEISRYFRIPESPLAAFGQAGIVFVLGVLFWLIGRGPFSGEFTGLILVAIPMLVVLTTILIGMGWSWDAARSGVIWGLGLVLGTYMIAAMSWASQRGQNDPAALWMPNPGTGQVALLEGTLQELGIMQNGRPDSIQVLSLVDTPSLRWMLRNIKDVTFVSTLKPEYLPPVILTPEDGSDLSQTMSYRGQDFLWSSYPGWFGPLPSQWWLWVTYRQASVNHESLVLWARSDLFPEESAATSDDEAVEPLEGLISPLEDDSPE